MSIAIHSRRALLRALAALPAVTLFPKLHAFAAPDRGKVKITAVRAMAIKGIANNSLVRVDTDAGISGFGEAGASGPMARARIETMKQHLIGKDPLAIEVHFHQMTSLMHTYMAQIGVISGIDMALWDLAGKLLNKRVCELMGGPFREEIAMYSHGDDFNMLDTGACKEWAARIKVMPEGFNAFKNSIDKVLGVPPARFANTLDSNDLRKVHRAYQNTRDAVGEDIDIAVHCHNEFDTPSAIAVAKAVEPMNPLFLEDPLNVTFHEGWAAVKRSTRIPILTGEKLEMVRGFKPFLDTQTADIIHPDLAFAGGMTGTKKIADYAALTRTPVALHNVGSLILCFASAHFGASIQNFYRSESALGRPARHAEKMAAGNAPMVRNSRLKVPEGPGLGLDLDMEYLKANLVDGEPFWS